MNPGSPGLVPNPGSDEALAMGCLCACMDNHYGAGMPYPDGPRFWVQANCPLHGLPKTKDISGMDPDFTGELSTEEYVHSMRGPKQEKPEMRLVKNVAEQDTQVDD